jgi:uncharacterized membrane protein
MHLILTAIGWRDLSFASMMMIAFVGGGTLLIFAFLMDVLLERFSFGIIPNFILLLIGIIGGLVALQWWGWPPNRREYLHALVLCSTCGVLVLAAAASLKRSV